MSWKSNIQGDHVTTRGVGAKPLRARLAMINFEVDGDKFQRRCAVVPEWYSHSILLAIDSSLRHLLLRCLQSGGEQPEQVEPKNVKVVTRAECIRREAEETSKSGKERKDANVKTNGFG